jgi:predicted transcriptional regulator
MARWGGGPQTYRALKGPMSDTKNEVVYTLSSIRETRAKVDRSEFVTVQKARRLGMTWTEIATALGVTRQAAWERLREAEESPVP